MEPILLTYEELMNLALRHYNDGGDGVYECWDRQTYDFHVELFGPITYSEAMGMFRRHKAVVCDWQTM